MEIKNFIKVVDGVMPLTCVSSIIRYLNTQTFNEAKITGDKKEEVNFNIRRTHTYSFGIENSSLTHQHWSNYIGSKFLKGIELYKQSTNVLDLPIQGLTNIDALKYEAGGFYTWHVDHGPMTPRTLSCILLLNDDYEGGDLCFRNVDGSQEISIPVKSARMIIWPSNFQYPHTIKPVIKGVRYSLVSWAL